MCRVLVAHDSGPARTMLRELFSRDSRMQLVGETADGAEAVQLTLRLKPGVVVMASGLPKPGAPATIRQIMSEAPTPVVVVGDDAEPGSAADPGEALRAGAVARATLPATVADEVGGRDLIRLILAMSEVKLVRRRGEAGQAWVGAPPDLPSTDLGVKAMPRQGRVLAVAIAASTGGPGALNAVLSPLPASFPAPILVVQHMSDGYMGGLANSLARATALRVKIAEAGEQLEPGTVYLAGDGRHLGVNGRLKVELSDAAPTGGFRPSASFLFASLASALGSSVVALVLTGMGSDGVEGLRKLKQRGATVIAQDEPTAVVFGMPGAAIREGLADLVLPLRSIAGQLLALVGR